MCFTEFFIKRSITTALIFAAIMGFGAISYFALPVSNLPEVEYPVIHVSAQLPGANPDVMAATVATPLESTFSLIPGLERMTSSSQTGQTDITLQFRLDRNIDASAQDVQAAISRAQGDLPASLPAPPSYSKVNPDADPILWLEMSSKTMSLEDFARYANDVFAKRIAMVSGVSQVPVWGASRPAIRVQVDAARLAAYGLDLEGLRSALSINSAALPSGTLFGQAHDYSLQTNSQLTSAAQFADVIIAYRNGAPVRLNQVAKVLNSTDDERSRFWINGQRTVILAVRKQPGVNTVQVADRVKSVILSLRGSMPPGVSFGKVADAADMVRDSIADANRTLLLTIVLVILVVFAFLGTLSATAIAAATIPVSMLGSFIAMHMLGYSVDLFSMMGITLSIGFVVDDAIVMIENIVRHHEMGKDRLTAAIDGSREVSFTIVSMTISLAAVFLPVLFLKGVLGRLLKEFAVTISVSILLSGFTALTLTPMLCSRFLDVHQAQCGGWQSRFERWHLSLERIYSRSLVSVLQHRKATLAAMSLTMAATAFLFIQIPKSFMPPVDVGGFSGHFEASQDNSMERMIQYGEQVNAVMNELPWVESNLSGIESQNSGWLHINLVDRRLRPNIEVVMHRLQEQLDRIPGLKVYLRAGQFLSLGEDEGRSQYSATLEGPDAGELYRWAPQLQAALAALPQLSHVSNNLEESAPRLNVGIRRDLAMSVGVDPERIANTLYDAYGNRRASTITADSRQYDVILEVADNYQKDPSALDSLYLLSASGRLVPLSAVTTRAETVAPMTVNHVGQFPAVTFSFDLVPGVSLDRATELVREAAARIGMPTTLTFEFAGTAAQFQSSLQGLGLLLFIAVLVIYLVLGVLYESFLHPITILSGLPAAAIGALVTLWICGQSLNLFSFLGIVLLVGIAKKNAIMIVDFGLHAELLEGTGPELAILHGCLQRFRPIMMTTMAALLGAIPIAVAGGAGGEARRPLGIAVVGGLLLSQSLTLYLTPVIYLSLRACFEKWANLGGWHVSANKSSVNI